MGNLSRKDSGCIEINHTIYLSFPNFYPCKQLLFVISITNLRTCAWAVAIAHSDLLFFFPLQILGGGWWGGSIAEAEMNKQKCTKPGNHKNSNSAGYPVT